MKKLFDKRNKTLRIFAGCMLALITIMIFAFAAPVVAFGVTGAFALVVGDVTLEGKDETIFRAMQEKNESILTKLNKEYITETKASELITANLNLTLKELGFDGYKDMETKMAKFDEMQTALEKQGLLITEMKSKVSEQGKQSLYTQVFNTLTENKESLTKWQNKQSPFNFELKDAVTMLNSTVTGFSYVGSTQTDFPFTRPALPRSLMLSYAKVRPTDSALISYADWGTIVASLSAITEGNQKTKISALLTAQQSNYHELGDFIKISERMLNDIPYMSGEITTLLTDCLEKAVDDALLLTTNWGLIAASGGIAPGYTSTSMDDSVSHAGELDAILACFVQIYEANFVPTLIAINPATWGKLMTAKASTFEYTAGDLSMVVNITPNGMTINGVPVVMSNKIPAGKVLVGDFSKANVWIYGGVNVEMGWDGEDFTYNLRTIKAWENVHFYVKTNEKPAFVYATIATVVAAISNGS
jgi:HK97 family phage major capsid protein